MKGAFSLLEDEGFWNGEIKGEGRREGEEERAGGIMSSGDDVLS